MKIIKVEYKVKKEELANLLPVIQEFIEAAQADKEHVAYYVGYQYANDPTKFVHLMKFASDPGEKYHQQAAYTKKFVDKLYPNCETKPKFEEINEVN